VSVQFFEYHTVVVHPPPAAVKMAAVEDVAVVVCVLTEFGNSRVFKQLYHSWLYIVCVFGVPFLSLVVLNAFLVDAVRKSRQRSRDLRPPSYRHAMGIVVTAAGAPPPAYQLEGHGRPDSVAQSSTNHWKSPEDRRSFFVKSANSHRTSREYRFSDTGLKGLETSACHMESVLSPVSLAINPRSSAYQTKAENRHQSLFAKPSNLQQTSSVCDSEKDGCQSVTSLRNLESSAYQLNGQKSLAISGTCPRSSEERMNFIAKPSNANLASSVHDLDGLPGTSLMTSGSACQLEAEDRRNSFVESANSHRRRSRREFFHDTSRESRSFVSRPADSLWTRLRRGHSDSALRKRGSSSCQLEGPAAAEAGTAGAGSSTPRPRSPSPVSRRIDTTVMLIGVVVIFLVCQFPALVSRIIWAFADDPSRAFTDLPLYALNETANFLILLNSSVNIVPYYFFGRRFRRQFLALFCPSCEVGRRAERRRVRCDSAADSALFSYSASHHRDSAANQHCL